MHYVVQMPWTMSRAQDKHMIRIMMCKIILDNICMRHRYFDPKWSDQYASQYSEIEKLVMDLAQREIFSTNRQEQLTIALHCTHLWLKSPLFRSTTIENNLLLAQRIIEQLESKIGNRYLYDFKVYRLKQMVKNKHKEHCRGYLLMHTIKSLNVNDQCDSNFVAPDYNFDRIRTLARKSYNPT